MAYAAFHFISALHGMPVQSSDEKGVRLSVRVSADFEPIFARSASAVIPSEKSSVNTNRKSTMRFPMSLR